MLFFFLQKLNFSVFYVPLPISYNEFQDLQIPEYFTCKGESLEVASIRIWMKRLVSCLSFHSEWVLKLSVFTFTAVGRLLRNRIRGFQHANGISSNIKCW